MNPTIQQLEHKISDLENRVTVAETAARAAKARVYLLKQAMAIFQRHQDLPLGAVVELDAIMKQL